MNNIPNLYIGLIIFFSGCAIITVLQYAYFYIRIRQRETFPLLVFSCVAFSYIMSDALALFFNFALTMNKITRFFILFRELIPVLFFIIAPYFMNKALKLKAEVKKINQILFWIGTASIIAIVAATAFSPDLLVTSINRENPDNYRGIIYHQDIGPLLIIRNIMLIIYMLYTIGIILFSNIREKQFIPMKNILAGITILCYFTLSHLYFILFTDNRTGFGNLLYPHFALGAVFFIIFMNFGAIDIFIKYNKQLNSMKKDLNRISYYDALLGIPNRMGFMKDLQSELDKIKTNGGNFSLVFLDIDDFKNLNECFSEGVGNEILKMLSQRLIEYFADAGSLYRIGGDDFVFLLKKINTLEEVKGFAGKVVACLRNSFSVSGISYSITASLGILQIPQDGNDTEIILNNAYSIIRSAKKTKNTFAVFSQELTNHSSRKIQIVNLLRSCVERDQFTLFYQPVVDINKQLTHAEALLRCTNPDLSIGGPGMFIPLMEEAGLINEVDNMVVRKAFHDMEMHIKKRFSISINLSVNQLVNPTYSDFLSSFARQHGIENQQIIVEVTEDNLMDNISTGRKNLLKLKNTGFRVAIDDFGKGFSSLTYLAELPVDILKMDMVFIQSVPGDSKKEAMAKHIIELAHSLDLKVIAEGFELQEQFDFYKGLGCDLFQGYYFSQPLPLDEFLAKYPA